MTLFACNTEWLSEQAPYQSDVTVSPAPPSASASPQGDLLSVGVGRNDICGVRADGPLYCRGKRLVFGTAPPQGQYRSVSVGDNSVCGVRDDGSVACSGRIEHGQVSPPEGSFTSVTVGGTHACGLRDDGSVACWGYNDHGQASPPEGSFTSVSAGWIQSCGVRDDGSIACWGYNEAHLAKPPEGLFTSVSVGDSERSCGVREDGSIACWGYVGARLATPPEGPFTSLSVGEDIACGLRENKTLACWGLQEYFTAPDNQPLDTLMQDKFISVSVGRGVSELYTDDSGEAVVDVLTRICAIREDGSVTCWGDVPGQLPTPTLSITNRTSDSLTLEWADPEWVYDSEPPRYYYYQLHASQSPEGPYNLVLSGVDAGTHIADGLQASAVYYLALLICDEFDCSQTMAVATTESDGPVSAPTTPPEFRGKKTVRSGTFAADDARLNWEPVVGATYYELWKGSEPDLPFEFVVHINAHWKPSHSRSPPTEDCSGIMT